MPLRTTSILGDINLTVVFVLLDDKIYSKVAPISGLLGKADDDGKKNEDGVGAAFVDASDAVQLLTLGG